MVDLAPGTTVSVVQPSTTIQYAAPGIVQGLWLKEGPMGPPASDADVAGYINNLSSATATAIKAMLGWTIAPPPTGGNDQPALQALLNDPNTKVLWLRAGTYNVNLAAHPVTAGTYSALTLRSGQRLVGPGRDQCSVKLIASQAVGIADGGIAVITNRTLTGGDEGISIEGIEVDGNAANQTKNHNGIVFIRTRGSSCTGVRVRNIRGTTNFPPNETFHFETQLGIDTTYIQCEAVGDSATINTASGFSADNCTNVTYVGCIGRGMRFGMGFTHYQTAGMSYSGCRAYSNGDIGFNSEESISVSYTDCHSGGATAPLSNYPYVAGSALANRVGFVINGTKHAAITGCTARYNVDQGLVLTPGSSGSSGAVTASTFTSNGAIGVSMSTITDPRAWRIDASVNATGNTGVNFELPSGLGGWQAGLGNRLNPAPALPASGTALTNTYPWPVTIYLVGGAYTLLQIDSTNIADTKVVRLAPGMSLTVFYSSAPTLIWWAL